MSNVHELERLVPVVLLLAASAVIIGCEASPPEGSPSTCSHAIALPTSVSTDILFVIDNSNSMRAPQEKVKEQLEVFIDALASSPLHNDFQIGVITTGVTVNLRGCDPSSTPTFIEYPEESGRLQRGKDVSGAVIDPTDDKIVRSDDPELLSKARRLLGQGIVGSPQEMGLEAMHLALTEPLISTPLDAADPGNLGFLRSGSRLMVIIVSDEDDCSDPTGTAIALQPACGQSCETDDDCAGEGHYCLELSGGNRECVLNHCETPEGRALLEPVSSYVDFLKSMEAGAGRPREVFLAVIGSVSLDDPFTPERCGDSEGRAVRYVEAVSQMGDAGFMASICREDFGQAMLEIAGLLDSPQTLELHEEPFDPRLLEVRVKREDGTSLTCPIGEGFEYHPPAGEGPATIEMLEPCRLRYGDEVQVNLLCAS